MFASRTQEGGHFFWKYFEKHIRSQYVCYHSKEKVWADVLNTHNTTIWLTKNFLRRFEKKVCKFLKSKYASSLSQFYMALVVFCMKFFTLNVSKKLSIHFLSTFYIFKTFSGTRAIQRTLNRVFAMRQTQANVDKSVKNVKFCSYVAYLIAYCAIWVRNFHRHVQIIGKVIWPNKIFVIVSILWYFKRLQIAP